MSEDLELSLIAKRFPLGTRVLYFPLSGEFDFEETKIRSVPWRLGHGAIVIQVENRSGGVSIEHVRLAPIQSKGEA